MDQLTLVKSIAEKALEVKGMPLDVVIECLSLREGRVSIDNVRDDVEAELNQVRQTNAQLQTNYMYEGSDRQTNKKRWGALNDNESTSHSIVGIIRKT